MRSARLVVGCLIVLSASACSAVRPSEDRPAPKPEPTRSTAATLGVPPGHLPPPGSCRIWVPGKPPGHQARARSCAGIERRAAAGTWILFRPSEDKKVVHVKQVHDRRPGVIVRLRVYDVRRGTLLRES